MTAHDRVFFLIDADNVSVEVVDQAFALKLSEHGALHVRRCYCNAEFAKANLPFLKKHSIRPMVNATAGKNCTDIALAIDAVQLALDDRPATVVIVASDSDFAPLVLHLRELGCRVEGVGQKGKTGADSDLVYDAFVELEGRKAKSSARRPKTSPRGSVAGTAAPSVAKAAAPSSTPGDAEVDAALDAIPALRGGAIVQLNQATDALRQAGLLGRSVPSTKFFRKHPEHFELTPERQPNKVRFVAATRRR